MSSQLLFWNWLDNNHATIIIASLAFFAAATQAFAAYVQNKLSVRPYLHVGFDNKKTHLCVFLENAGLGPAIIEDYYVVFENNIYRGEKIIDAFRSNLAQKWNVQVYSLKPGCAVPIGPKQTVLEIELNAENEFETMQDFIDENFELIIKYKSFQNERRTYSTNIHVWQDYICSSCKNFS